MSKKKIDEGNIVVLEFPTKMVTLILTQFDTDIDTDRLMFLQVHNIPGELMTWPIIMNRIGNLKADQESIVAETKMDFDIFLANWQEKKRKELTVPITDAKGNTKMDKPTKDEVENAVLLSAEYRVKHLHKIKIETYLKYVDALYWSAKTKADILLTYSAKLKPEEFEKEIIEGTINGIMIKVTKKSIA